MIRTFEHTEPRTIEWVFICRKNLQTGKHEWRWVKFGWSFGQWVSLEKVVINEYGFKVNFVMREDFTDVETYKGWA